jgi:hypothetical protein
VPQNWSYVANWWSIGGMIVTLLPETVYPFFYVWAHRKGRRSSEKSYHRPEIGHQESEVNKMRSLCLQQSTAHQSGKVSISSADVQVLSRSASLCSNHRTIPAGWDSSGASSAEQAFQITQMQATDKIQDGHSGRKPLGHDESARKVGTSHESWRKGLERRQSRDEVVTPMQHQNTVNWEAQTNKPE